MSLKGYGQLDLGSNSANLKFVGLTQKYGDAVKTFFLKLCLLSWPNTTPNFKSIAISDDDIVGVDIWDIQSPKRSGWNRVNYYYLLSTVSYYYMLVTNKLTIICFFFYLLCHGIALHDHI